MPFLTISSYVTKYRLFYEAFMLLVKCLVTHIAERFFRDLTAPAGDINLDMIKYETHDVTNGYLGTMSCNEFMPTILLPTRVMSNTCTLIDHLFYCSKTFKDNFISGNLFTDITDHSAIFLILGSPKRYQSHRPLVRIFSDKNKENFKDILQKMNLRMFEDCRF